MLALLGPIFGIFGSLLPSIVDIFKQRQEYAHNVEMAKLQLQAAVQQASLQLDIENIKADINEGDSVRSHDTSIDGGIFINALRASIRPVITYSFFLLFVAIKVSAAYVMIQTGKSVPEMLQAVWDQETMALFSTIIAFWFGSRVLEKMNSRNNKTITVTANVKKK